MAEFIDAGRIVAAARTRAPMREATDRLAAGVLAIGADRFLPFLRQADDHLTAKGGLLTLVRDVPAPQVAPAGPRPIAWGGSGQAGTLLQWPRGVRGVDHRDKPGDDETWGEGEAWGDDEGWAERGTRDRGFDGRGAARRGSPGQAR